MNPDVKLIDGMKNFDFGSISPLISLKNMK